MRRLLLLPFPALAAAMGLGYAFGDPVRTNSASFTFAKELAPMPAWGLIFLIGAIVLSVTLATHSRAATTLALLVGGGIYTWWGLCLAASTVLDPRASLNAWAVYLTIAFAHYFAAHRTWTRP